MLLRIKNSTRIGSGNLSHPRPAGRRLKHRVVRSQNIGILMIRVQAQTLQSLSIFYIFLCNYVLSINQFIILHALRESVSVSHISATRSDYICWISPSLRKVFFEEIILDSTYIYTNVVPLTIVVLICCKLKMTFQTFLRPFLQFFLKLTLTIR